MVWHREHRCTLHTHTHYNIHCLYLICTFALRIIIINNNLLCVEIFHAQTNARFQMSTGPSKPVMETQTVQNAHVRVSIANL